MLQTLARNWWAVVLRGVFAVLFGLGTFLWPGLTLAVLVLMYGGYLFIDGAWLSCGRWRDGEKGRSPGGLPRRPGQPRRRRRHAPLAGVTALALLYVIAVWAIVRGVFEIIAAFTRVAS